MTSISETPGVRRALCCECGNLRTVSANYPGRNYVPEGESPERIALLSQHNHAYWSKRQPWERLLEDLKCSACKTITRHATLRDDKYRNHAEERNRPVVLSNEDMWVVIDAAIAQLRDCGIRVTWLDDDREWVLGWLYRYLDDGVFELRLNEAIPARDVMAFIDWAWFEMADSEEKRAKWAVAAATVDDPPLAWRACVRKRSS